MLTKNLEANVLMNIEIKFGIPKNQQKNIANIFFEHFRDKFKFFFGNKQKAITLIASNLEDDRIFVAVKNKKVIGFAGLQYRKKTLIKNWNSKLQRSQKSLIPLVIYGF